MKSYDFSVINAVASFLNSDFEGSVRKNVEELTAFGLSDEDAVRLLIGEGGGLDTHGKDRGIFSTYFPLAVKKASTQKYLDDEYYKNVKFKGAKEGKIELCSLKYDRFEPFVENDLTEHFDGMILPHVAFFDQEFNYPAVKENGRIWMTVTPNEINTMEEPIKRAKGKVLALGLGLGYFAYSCAIKSEVEKVTVIEKNPDVISIFNKHILPFFKNADKLEIINADAFDFMQSPTKTDFDFVFCDLWHDVSDGAPMLLKLKDYEKNFEKADFSYWIEKSIKFYL